MTVGQLLDIIDRNNMESETEIHIMTADGVRNEIETVGITVGYTSFGDEVHDIILWERG